MKHLKQIMVLLALVVAMVGCDKEEPIPAPTGYIKIDNTTLQNGIQATIINNGVTDDVQNVTYTLYVDMTTLTDNTTGYNSALLTLETATQGSTADYAGTFVMDEDSKLGLTKATVLYIRADGSRVERVFSEGTLVSVKNNELNYKLNFSGKTSNDLNISAEFDGLLTIQTY